MVKLSESQMLKDTNVIKIETKVLEKLIKRQKHPRDTWSNIICREMFGTTEL